MAEETEAAQAAAQAGTGIAGAADYHPPTEHRDPICFGCGKPITGASYAAMVVPPLEQVCSKLCLPVLQAQRRRRRAAPRRNARLGAETGGSQGAN